MRSPSVSHWRLWQLFITFFLVVFCGGGFAASSILNQSRFADHGAFQIHRDLFALHVPLHPSWVWVYLLYYPLCFLPLLLAEVRSDPKVFFPTALGFLLQFSVSFVTFFAWPVQVLHPILHGGFTNRVLMNLYHCDGGFNSFPSLHVANVTFVAFLFLRLGRYATGTALVGLAFLIAVSAVLIGQHYVYDVAAGAVLGGLSLVTAFRLTALLFPEAAVMRA